jgi:predicted nucleic acid-binding protein
MSVPDAEPESCFVDTNIWLYAFIEGDDPQKTARAKALLEASRAIMVSTQVINEVCINLLKKAQFSEQQVQELIESFYAKYRVVELHTTHLLKASALREQYAFSFWDSLIVSSVLHAAAACSTQKTCKMGWWWRSGCGSSTPSHSCHQQALSRKAAAPNHPLERTAHPVGSFRLL